LITDHGAQRIEHGLQAHGCGKCLILTGHALYQRQKLWWNMVVLFKNCVRYPRETTVLVLKPLYRFPPIRDHSRWNRRWVKPGTCCRQPAPNPRQESLISRSRGQSDTATNACNDSWSRSCLCHAGGAAQAIKGRISRVVADGGRSKGAARSEARQSAGRRETP